MEFEDKIAVVTGAGHGIGRAVALAYAEKKAHVIIAEINAVLAEETLSIINDASGSAEVIITDVAVPENVKKLFDSIRQKFGSIDILINNAGVSVKKNLFDMSVEDWDRILNTNLRGMFLCAKNAAELMREKKKGSIINIASTRAIMSEADSEAYAASKGGIVSLTHALSASLSVHGIQVNCISPGWINTGDSGLLTEIDHKQHFSGRVGIPEDIARACLYLSAEGNNFINGTNLIIDGGMTKKMIYEE